MRELSLNILDIVQNSIAAEAQLIEMDIVEQTKAHKMIIQINDNGSGMTSEQLLKVQDPFFTTRTTRKIGLGVPLFKMAAEMSGGRFNIRSEISKGTWITAEFDTSHVDFVPLGDICSTYCMLVGMNTDRDFVYHHNIDDSEFTVDTRQLKEILGDVPLNEPDVMEWIKAYIEEQIKIIRGGAIDEIS